MIITNSHGLQFTSHEDGTLTCNDCNNVFDADYAADHDAENCIVEEENNAF